MNDGDKDDNEDNVPVKVDVIHILSLRTSLSCYEKKVNKKSRNTKGNTTRIVLWFNVTIMVNYFLSK